MSYKVTVGKIVPNLMNNSLIQPVDIKSWEPLSLSFERGLGNFFLSPVIDFHTREVLAYDLSTSPNLDQIVLILTRLIKDHGTYLKGSMMQSD
jgi:transposase InsO family protein